MHQSDLGKGENGAPEYDHEDEEQISKGESHDTSGYLNSPLQSIPNEVTRPSLKIKRKIVSRFLMEWI
jgi:hypothetical protein